jgi:hypothetical protein
MDDGHELTLRVLDRVVPSEWDSLIRSLDGGFFHSSAWVALRSATQRAEPRYFTWLDPPHEQPHAAALGFIKPPAEQFTGRLFGRVHFNSPPASASGMLQLVPSLLAWMRRDSPLVEATLGVLDGRRRWSYPEARAPVRGVEFVVRALDGGFQLGGLREMIRRTVKKADRLGVDVQRVTDERGTVAFARLAAGLHDRLRAEKAADVVPIDATNVGRAWHQLTSSGHGRLYVASLDGEPVSGCLFGLFGDRAYYLQNGATPTARQCGATHRILVTAIGQLLDEGYIEVNLGVVAADAEQPEHVDHGLFMFKQGFGSQRHHCEGGVAVARPLRSQVLHWGLRARQLRARRG